MPIAVTILYFAAIREIVGRSEEKLELPDNVATIRALAAHLESHEPRLRRRLGGIRWACNEELVELECSLHDGDVVALIPPVAGG